MRSQQHVTGGILRNQRPAVAWKKHRHGVCLQERSRCQAGPDPENPFSLESRSRKIHMFENVVQGDMRVEPGCSHKSGC